MFRVVQHIYLWVGKTKTEMHFTIHIKQISTFRLTQMGFSVTVAGI